MIRNHYLICMETKYNDATLNRPKGNRIIDAPFVFIDLEKYARQLISEEAWAKNDRNSITVHKTERFTQVLCCLRGGAMIKDNLVSGFISFQVIEGKIDITIVTGRSELTRQQIITIHPNIIHTVKATENSLILITTTMPCR
jgi:quercetin dioxygenase-like cupin family protein